MDEEPGHKAMLYFLEVLMNSNGPLTISQLAGRFGSRNFTAEMRLAAGGNETGLKKYLLKYPSLFTVTGNMVSLFDGSVPSSKAGRESSPTSSTASLPDVSTEMEAVRYFQNQAAKKEEKWIPIKSLAGHLSQASVNVRNCVGPQLEFRRWLLKHPHIFEVNGDFISLRHGISTPTLTRKSDIELLQDGLSSAELQSAANQNENTVRNYRPVPPKTPPANRRFPPKTPPASRKFRDGLPQSTADNVSGNAPTPGSSRKAPITMTANEYKAVMFLKGIIEKKPGLKVHSITGHFSQAPEGVRNTIGWTKMELEEFLKKNANVFDISEDEVISVRKNARMNVIITGSRPQIQSTRTLTDRKGRIFHVAKLWGIIDLGKHEHVFFDKSIMDRHIDDLQKEYTVGEILNFNAVMAPKTSRAKWRAIQVWKENENQPMSVRSSGDFGSTYNRSCAASSTINIEDEINELLRRNMEETNAINGVLNLGNDPFSDAVLSASGVVAIWNENSEEGDEGDSLSMVSESYHMCSSSLNELRLVQNVANSNSNKDESDEKKSETGLSTNQSMPAVNGLSPNRSPKNLVKQSSVSGKKTAEVACQTVSTGEIIATQLYKDKGQ